MGKYIIYTDGASRGNPGDAGIGVAIYVDNNIVEEYSEYIGYATNNIAEYTALKTALIKATTLNAKTVDLYLDSELVVRQINGEYKVKNNGLKSLYIAIKDLLKNFESYTINYIPREMNKKADGLANKGIDNFLSNNP